MFSAKKGLYKKAKRKSINVLDMLLINLVSDPVTFITF